jgi:flagellar protein FlbB
MGKRILILLLGNLALLTIAILIFDTLGIIDYKGFLYENVPFIKKYFEQKLEDPTLLEKESLLRYKEELDYMKSDLTRRLNEIKSREEKLSAREIELQQKLAEVEEIKANLEKQQKIFQDYNDKIAKLANYIRSLPPDDASKILENMKDDMIVDILLKIDQLSEREGTLSISSFLLSKLPPDRAARIGQKILEKQ